MLRIDGEYVPVADLRALPLADLIEREPQIVEHGWMVGRAAQGQSVMAGRGQPRAFRGSPCSACRCRTDRGWCEKRLGVWTRGRLKFAVLQRNFPTPCGGGHRDRG